MYIKGEHTVDVQRVIELMQVHVHIDDKLKPQMIEQNKKFVAVYAPQIYDFGILNIPCLEALQKVPGLKVIGAAVSGNWSLFGVQLESSQV